ncbi:hypothetical protein WJX73_007995 [Symbiochloris irregularis]|uniref:SET domain-containing protein n=1 Tax=Symbiochloris irregularis TaxID=706552 RepID=A0AAW1NV61_9CHLO
MTTTHERLLEWLKSQGGYALPDLALTAPSQLSSVSVCEERGICAKSDVAEGTRLLEVPLHLCLHLHSSESPETACAVLRKQESLPIFLATVALLLHELGKGQQSTFAAHLQSLPDSHNCTFAWQEQEQQWLRGTGAESVGPSAAQLHADQVLPVLKAHPGLWPDHVRTLEAFKHAAGMVQSRTFHMREENWLTNSTSEGEVLYMLPAIDMVNHSSDPAKRNCKLDLQQTKAASLDGTAGTAQGSFMMSAARDIAAGEEVLYTYGDLSDAELLQTYGFIENLDPVPGQRHVNPNASVSVPISLIQECCADSAAKAPCKVDQPAPEAR